MTLETEKGRMTRAVTERANAIARQFEALRTTAYRHKNDVWSIGYGHTKGVTEGQICTAQQAEGWLGDDFFDAARALEAKIGEANALDLTDNQHDALCDFVFNLGTGDPKKPEWLIWGLLRSRSYDQIPAQIARFVYLGQTKLDGLVKRRNAEIALWSEGEPGSAAVETSSAETRTGDTPPAAPATKPQSIKAHVVTAVCAAGALCTQYAQPVKDAADQLAAFSGSHIISHISEILLTVAGLATLAGLVSAMLKNKQAAQ